MVGRRRERGNAMLEFAIGSGVFLALFAGTFQFGFTFFRYNTLYNAIRNGAQYASLKAYDSNTATPSSAFRTAVQNMVVYGTSTPAGGTARLVPGLNPTDVTVAVTFQSGVPREVTVGVSSYTINAVFQTYNFTNKPRMTFPYLGIYSPP